LVDASNNIPCKRKLLNEAPNQSSSNTGQQQISSNSNNNNNNGGSVEETGHDLITHRALLKNEFLKHAIIDVRVR
jgi:hypothetical protein